MDGVGTIITKSTTEPRWQKLYRKNGYFMKASAEEKRQDNIMFIS